MQDTEDKMKSDLKPHPAPGWLAVIPIPGSEEVGEPETGPEPPAAVLGIVAKHLDCTPEEAHEMMTSGPSMSTLAAIVMEVGASRPGQPEYPFETGHTVYFPSDRGVDIGGNWKFLIADRVIAFTKEDE